MKRRYPKELLRIARSIASLADIYWDEDCFPKEFQAAEGSWLRAIVQFDAVYAPERMGAPKAYRRLTRDALLTAGSGLRAPTHQFARSAWQEFARLAREANLGSNSRANPLALSSGTANISSLQFILELDSDGHNILRWAVRMLKEGRAEEAHSALLRIRGIGPKLAAFYLRDVAGQYALKEDPAWCFQPIDVWIWRIAQYWGPRMGYSVDNHIEAASVFADLANAAGVRGGRLNAGAWVLGSQLLDGELERTVATWRGFKRCLEGNLRWNQAVAKAVGQVLG